MAPGLTPARILILARTSYDVKVIEPLTRKKWGADVLAATPEAYPEHVPILAYAPRHLKLSSCAPLNSLSAGA